MYLNPDDLKLIQQTNKDIKLKLEFIDRQRYNDTNFISYGTITGNVVSFNVNIDGSSDCRRTLDLEMLVKKDDTELLVRRPTLIKWLVRPYYGIKDNTTNNYKWYLCGTFAFTERSYSYNVDSNILSLSCMDLSAYYDGTLGGNIIGASDINIYSNYDSSNLELVRNEYSSDGSDILAAYFQEGVGILVNVPYELSVKKAVWQTNKWVDTDLVESHTFGGTISIYTSTDLSNFYDTPFEITGVDSGTVIDEDDIEIVNYTSEDSVIVDDIDLVEEYGLKHCITVTVDNDALDKQFKIVPKTNIDILLIQVNDNAIYQYLTQPIINYSFVGKGFLHTYNSSPDYIVDRYDKDNDIVGQTDYYNGQWTIDNSLVITTADSTYAELIISDSRWHKLGSNYSDYRTRLEKFDLRKRIGQGDDTSESTYILGNIDYGNMEIDTSITGSIKLKDALVSCLTQAGIQNYDIAIDITEDVPYDQEFSYGENWFNVISTLCKLYSDIEYFFDVNGTFIIRHIPTELNETVLPNGKIKNGIFLNDEVLKPLVINENITDDLTGFYNISEIWGNSLVNDYYSANEKEANDGVSDNVSYNSSTNTIEAIFNKVTLDDNNNIPNNTNFGVNMPNNITGYNQGIKLQIHNANSNTLVIPPIGQGSPTVKMWSCTEDFYDDTKQRTIDANAGLAGVDQPLHYGGCDFYGYRGVTVGGTPFCNLLMQDSNLRLGCIIDGIDFRLNYLGYENEEPPEAMGIYLHRPNFINDETTKTIKLDITQDTMHDCIRFTANKGEVIRVYYSQFGISFADSQGNILTNYTSSVNIDNKISYIDFYPRDNGTYYVFSSEAEYQQGIGNSSGAVYFFGMAKSTVTVSGYPIYNLLTNSLIDKTIFKPNESYSFEFINNKLYYLGQWQVHGLAIELKKVPNSYKNIKEKYNCNNIIITQYNPSLAVDVIGEKGQQLSGGVYENIPNDSLVLQRSEWENWKSLRNAAKLTLRTMFIPNIEVNEKIEYTTFNGIKKIYLLEKVNISDDGMIELTMNEFYPLYIPDNKNYIAVDDIDTTVLVDDITGKTTPVTEANKYTTDNMFISSLYNYNLFVWDDYRDTYLDEYLAKLNNTPNSLWKQWCVYGIEEGRNWSDVFKFRYYLSDDNDRGYKAVASNIRNEYYQRVNSIWRGFLATLKQNGVLITEEEIERRLNNLACYLYFIEVGINDFNTKASDKFDIQIYSLHKDLQELYGNDYRKYYEHYMKYNYLEHRKAI